MGPSGEETPPSPPPGFPFQKSSKSKGKKPMITSTGEPPPRSRPRPRPRPPPGSVSRTYREDTCSSSSASTSFYSSRHPGELSSAPYRSDASAIVCGGNTISPCCQGDSSHSPPPFADGEFPVGLRVLLVDDDQICLTIVSQLLTECRYRVTCCNHPRLALSILRERKGEIDVVITDVYMPEIDGFELLELVATEMDIPVVMMSVDCGVEVARRGIENGACYYLMKPVSKEEVRNVWQHVFLWKNNLSGQGGNAITGDNPQANNPEGNPSPENPRPVAASSNEDKPSKRSRHGRESEEGNCDDNELNELGSQKKHRVIWNAELHGHFLKAVNELGYDKAVPKKILELMNVPGITRENIASHLQKYRIFLRRLSSDANLPLHPTPRQTLGTAGTKNWPPKQRSDLSGNRHCAWKVVQPGFFLPGFPLYMPPQSNAWTTKPNPNANADDSANPNADANATPPSNVNPTNQFQYTTDPADPTSNSSIVPANYVFQQQPPAAAGPLEDFQQTFPPLPAFNHMSPSHVSLRPNIAENPNPEFGMDLNLMAMSPPPPPPPPPSSSSFGVGPTWMVDQQQLLPPGPSTSTAQFGGDQGWQGFGGGGNNYHWQGVHAGSSSSSPSMFSYSGIPPSNYTGLCMTSSGGLYGLTRTGPILEASGSDNSIGSLFDEMRKGKKPMVEEDEDDFQLPDIDFTDFDEEWICFNDMLDSNRNANTNQGDQEKAVTTENDVSDGNGTPSLRESSLPLYSDNEDFDDFFFQQLEGVDFSFPDFDFSSFNLDDNHPPAQ